MTTYALYTASYGSNYANLKVRILEQSTGIPAIIMASATSGILSSNGNAVLDASGNLNVYLDNSKTFQVWNNQFLMMPNGISLATEVQRTAAQVGGTPTLSDIGLGPGATFFLDTDPTTQYRISADKTQYVLLGGSGGGGVSTFNALTDRVTAPIATTNTSVANGLASKVSNLGTFSSPSTLQAAFPAGTNLGATAFVGSSAPYSSYTSNGSVWAPTGVTSFSNLSDSSTANIASINTSVSTALSSKVTNVGTFASTSALQAAFPAAGSTGAVASVGASAPYVSYTSNGLAWVLSNTATFAGLTDAATAPIATSNSSVSTALATKVANLGTFASSSALQAAFPASAYPGAIALVGSSAPYAQYSSNGATWNAGGGGAVSSVNAQVGAVVLTARNVGGLALPSATYNAATLIAYDVNSNSLGTLTSGVAPPVDASFTVVGAPTATASALSPSFSTIINGDVLYFDSVNYQKISSGSIGITTSAIIKGDNQGGALAAIPGVDYGTGYSLICNVPVGNAPSNTIGANGSFTGWTNAVPAQTLSGYYDLGVWLYFPANSLSSNNAAGFYWTVFTSTTAGTVFNTTYTPGINSGPGSWRIPSSPTPFSGTTGSAFTGITTNLTTHSLTIPGNYLGPFGSIDCHVIHHNTASPGNKTVSTTFGGSNIGYYSFQTTNTNHSDGSIIRNAGSTGRQGPAPTSKFMHTASSFQCRNVDTTANQTFTLTQSTTTATDFNIIESYAVTLTPGA